MEQREESVRERNKKRERESVRKQRIRKEKQRGEEIAQGRQKEKGEKHREERERKKVRTGKIKRNRGRRRRTGQHRETITEEQRNRSKRNPTTINIHRCCPLTCRTRDDKEIKKETKANEETQRESPE
jgi:hypothetical protein